MSTDKKPDASEDTSKPGREEEVISNRDSIKSAEKTESSSLKEKGEDATEGERRFKEGMANNSDTTP